MKNKICQGVASLLIVMATAQISHGGIMLSLLPSANLDTLQAGDTVGFDVVLSGLAAGDELEFLAASVEFDPFLLGMPLGIAPGTSIPDVTGFIPTSLPGLADAFYDGLFIATSGENITSNGVFFSFELIVQAPGAGTIGFAFVDSFGSDSLGNMLSLAEPGPALAFSATPSQTGVIPEPASYCIWAGLVFICFGHRVSRRRRQSVFS